MTALLDIRDLRYQVGGRDIVHVPYLSVQEKEHLLLLGASGSGKTSFLHLMAGLLEPSEGTLSFAGENFSGLDASGKDKLRGRSIGFVFQGNHLIRHMSVFQNIAIVSDDAERILQLLETLGLKGMEQRKASSLSFGEAQRVGIARAVAHKPKLILADEPTSALDDDNAMAVITLLKQQAIEAGAALIVCTHDARIKDGFDRIVVMRDGKAVAA